MRLITKFALARVATNLGIGAISLATVFGLASLSSFQAAMGSDNPSRSHNEMAEDCQRYRSSNTAEAISAWTSCLFLGGAYAAAKVAEFRHGE